MLLTSKNQIPGLIIVDSREKRKVLNGGRETEALQDYDKRDYGTTDDYDLTRTVLPAGFGVIAGKDVNPEYRIISERQDDA